MWSIFCRRIVISPVSLHPIMYIPIIRIIWPTMTAGKVKCLLQRITGWQTEIIIRMAFIWKCLPGIIKCLWSYRNSARLPPGAGHSWMLLPLVPRDICRSRSRGKRWWTAMMISGEPAVQAALFSPGRTNGLREPGIPWRMWICQKRHTGVIFRQMSSFSA